MVSPNETQLSSIRTSTCKLFCASLFINYSVYYKYVIITQVGLELKAKKRGCVGEKCTVVLWLGATLCCALCGNYIRGRVVSPRNPL